MRKPTRVTSRLFGKLKFVQNTMVVLFRYWGDDEMTALPPKGDGKLVMTSDFITIFGLLKYDIKPRFNRCIHVSIAG